MKNNYEILGDVTAIELVSPKYGRFETLIDTVDLEKVDSFPNTWYVKYDPSLDGYYVQGSTSRKDGKKMIRFHRLIMDFPEGVVDHINHDTLDNRRSCNLRVATWSENRQNMLGAAKNNKCGVLGVHWAERRGRWVALIAINGKTKCVGYFREISEAERAVKEARKLYLPFSQEALDPYSSKSN